MLVNSGIHQYLRLRSRLIAVLVLATLILTLVFPIHAFALDADSGIKASMSATWEDDQVRYRIAIRNTGTDDVKNLSVKAKIPAGDLLSWSGHYEPILKKQNIEWLISVFPGGELELLEYVIDTKSDDPENVPTVSAEIRKRGSGKSLVTLKDVEVGSFVGGLNEAVDLYYIPKDYPSYSETGVDLGVLSGTWNEIGVQYGKKAGDLIRAFFDATFEQAANSLGGAAHVVEDVQRYNISINDFSPQAVEFMEGIAEGASDSLGESKFASLCTHYEKIVFLNSQYCLLFGHPGPEGHFPLPEQTSEEAAAVPVAFEAELKDAYEGCTGIALAGPSGATKDGKTIFAHNCDVPFFPYMSRLTYIAVPDDPDAQPYWCVTEPGKISALMATNSKGVSTVIFSGPRRTWVPEEGIFERSFGVPWPIIVFMQAAYTDTRAEAVEMLTLGTPEYRDKTERNSLLRARQNSWLIADPQEVCVVEATAHRYAVRFPGDHGEDGYVVVANHFVSDFSYNENNELTDFPMTAFGNENTELKSTPRYYTLWWLAKQNHGSIDTEMVKNFMESHFYMTKDGHRVDYVWDNEHGWIPATLGHNTVCSHGGVYPESYTGSTCDSKVANLTDRIVEFKVGRPCEWEGMPQVFRIPH